MILSYNEGGVNKNVSTSEVSDGWGQLTSSVDVYGAQTNYSYDSMGRRLSRTNPFPQGGAPGPSTTYQYDQLSRVTVTTQPDGNTVQNTYTGSNIVQVTDQVNRKIKRESDSLGRVTRVTEQDISTGNLTQETTYIYDIADRLTGVNQGNQSRAFKYDAQGNLLFARIPEMSATINDGTGTYWTTKYSYTDFGAIAAKTDARGVITTNGFDSLNRLISVTYNTSGAPGVAPTNNVAYSYDNSQTSATKGLLLSTTMTGPLATYTESLAYDDLKRVSSRTWSRDGQSYAVNYQYNTANQMTQMIYPVTGRTLNIAHDNTGRLSSLADQYRTYVNNITHNSAGEVTGVSLGNVATESYGYDANRLQLTSQTATQTGGTTNGLLNLNYGYQASADQSGTGSTAGDSAQLMSISGTINGTAESAAYTYDDLSRLVTSNQATSGSSAQRRFAYDRWNNRTGMWDATSGGNQIQTINLQQSGGVPTNRIQSTAPGRTNFALASNGSTAIASSTFSSSYPASAAINGDRKGVNWGNGGGWNDATASSYPDWIEVDFSGAEAIDEMDVFTLQDNSGSPSEPTESMTFSNYGIVDFQVQYWNGISWATVSGGSITGNNKVWKKLSFSQITTSKIRVNVTNALASNSRVTELEAWGPAANTSYSYDANGNLTNDGVHAYDYDAENRLKGVDAGATASYAYDYENRRIKKVAGSTSTHYVWEGSQVIAENDATTGAAIYNYVYSGNRLIARVGSGVINWYVSDRLSERLVLDANGNVIGRMAHLPFGEGFGESGAQEKRHFTSYDRDSDSNTDYAVNRQYSASIGRFMSVDPAGGKTPNPQSFNRYSYVGNDPVTRIDPVGLQWEFLCSASWLPDLILQISCVYFWVDNDAATLGNISVTMPFVDVSVALDQIAKLAEKLRKQRQFEDKAKEKAAEMLKKEECGEFMAALMQLTSQVAQDPVDRGQIGPLTPRFYLAPPSPDYALNLYATALNSTIVSADDVPGKHGNVITIGETTWVGFDVTLTWHKEFFDLGPIEAAQQTLHESLHLIPNFDDIVLANTAARMAGTNQTFKTIPEASLYLNSQIQSHCE